LGGDAPGKCEEKYEKEKTRGGVNLFLFAIGLKDLNKEMVRTDEVKLAETLNLYQNKKLKRDGRPIAKA
jgi:hypothetical protein